MVSSTDKPRDKPKEKLKVTHWSLIGKRFKYINLKDDLNGQTKCF